MGLEEVVHSRRTRARVVTGAPFGSGSYCVFRTRKEPQLNWKDRGGLSKGAKQQTERCARPGCYEEAVPRAALQGVRRLRRERRADVLLLGEVPEEGLAAAQRGVPVRGVLSDGSDPHTTQHARHQTRASPILTGAAPRPAGDDTPRRHTEPSYGHRGGLEASLPVTSVLSSPSARHSSFRGRAKSHDGGNGSRVVQGGSSDGGGV